jgi:predicted transcriptional regulator
MALNAYRTTKNELSDESIAYLAKSQYRRTVLETLRKNPTTKAELAALNHLPSRSTIHRIIHQCEDLGWVTKNEAGAYIVTSTGETTHDSYRLLAAEFEQLIDKSELLNRLTYWAKPPVGALSDAELVVDTNEDPHAIFTASVEAADIRSGGLDNVRSITPLFSPALYDIFGEFVDQETTFEVIYDQPTYQQLTDPRHIHYLARMIASPNVEVRIHPDPLYTGIGVYNQETVMICGSMRSEQQYGVVGDVDELLTWANETFDRLWTECQSPSGRFAKWLKQTVDPRV